jgi:hypothetical protein
MTNTVKPIFPLMSMRRLCLLLHIVEHDLWNMADNAAAHYSSFDIWKGQRPDGSDKGWRHIDNPYDDLKALQDKIYVVLLKPLAPNMPLYLTGGMPGRSILDNGTPHIGKPVVVALDVKNCFPSIPYKRIFEVWRNDLGCSDKVATVLTKLTTHHGHLPQGATTSPMLCNLALAPMAAEIATYAATNSLTYTQYVDDVTLSGDKAQARAAIKDVMPLAQRHGYLIGRDKNTIMDRNEIQRTTGVMVNNELTVPRQKIQSILREIKHVGSLGNAATTYEVNRIWGLVEFVKSVNAKRGAPLEAAAKNAIGDITGRYVERPKNKTRRCKSIHANHKAVKIPVAS